MTEDTEVYDSRPDTYAHIQMVQRIGNLAVVDLLRRFLVHDASKLVDPERTAYNGLPAKLEGLDYGSPEYRAQLQHPAIKGHQTGNDHHPEFFSAGIKGMTLIQMLEMICDWTAASRRMSTGDIYKSIALNAKRFGYGPEIERLLRNTVDALLEMEENTYGS